MNEEILIAIGVFNISMTGVWLQYLTTTNSGFIMTFPLVWYAFSNYLCANAVFHCSVKLPFIIRIWSYFALLASAMVHLVEPMQYFQIIDRSLIGYGDIDHIDWIFRISSLIGIWAVMIEWLLMNKEASDLFKLILSLIFLFANYWELYLQFAVFEGVETTILWHTYHIIISHIGLSMMPPAIVWLHHPDINIVAYPWDVKQTIHKKKE